MIIRWIAHSCFQLVFREKAILTDPFEGIGYEMPDIDTDIVTVSHQHFDHNAVGKVKSYSVLLDRPGHYEYGDMVIDAIPSFHDECCGEKRGSNLIFTVGAEGLKLTHLGDLGHLPSEEQYEAIKGTDVLMVPVGGNYTIDAEKAFEICKTIRPNIIIPMHYRTEGLTVDIEKGYHFEELVKGYYDVAHVHRDEMEIRKDDLKHNTRVVYLANRYVDAD